MGNVKFVLSVDDSRVKRGLKMARKKTWIDPDWPIYDAGRDNVASTSELHLRLKYNACGVELKSVDESDDGLKRWFHFRVDRRGHYALPKAKAIGMAIIRDYCDDLGWGLPPADRHLNHASMSDEFITIRCAATGILNLTAQSKLNIGDAVYLGADGKAYGKPNTLSNAEIAIERGETAIGSVRKMDHYYDDGMVWIAPGVVPWPEPKAIPEPEPIPEPGIRTLIFKSGKIVAAKPKFQAEKIGCATEPTSGDIDKRETKPTDKKKKTNAVAWWLIKAAAALVFSIVGQYLWSYYYYGS